MSKKPTLYLTVGIPCSGKTTWAEENAEKLNAVNINRDDIRFKVLSPKANNSTFKRTRFNEEFVTEVQNGMANAAVLQRRSIIISDTNLNKVVRDRWKKFAQDSGYDFVIKEFPVTFEEAVRRDTIRPNGVGSSVIYKGWQRWLDYKGERKYNAKESASKKPCIIVDIDGTIAINNGGRTAYDMSRVKEDAYRFGVIEAVLGMLHMYDNAQLIFLSGRDESAREDTIEWLRPIFGETGYHLYMRGFSDNRNDRLIKEELFFNHINDKYSVLGVFDDRPRVVRMWYDIGIPTVFSVANQEIEF